MEEGPNVLVVEDDPVLQELLWFNLKLAGHRVATASDGHTALAMIAEHRPDVVVLDMMMPGCDGSTVLRTLRADPENDSIAVVVVTAKATDADIWRGWQDGADDYLTKPVKISAVVDLVSGLVGQTSGRRVHVRSSVG